MNLQRLQRRAHIAGLGIKAAMTWLIFNLEPVGSEDKLEYRADYKTAKRQFDQALLKDREARLNGRVS